MNAGFITIRYVLMIFFLINDERARENGDDASG